MKKYIISLVILFSISLGLWMCSAKSETSKVLAIDESAIAVRLVPIQQDEFSQPIISSGLIGTENESKLSFKIGGIITKIYVREGETVARGQILATLDLTEVDAQVSQAKNNLEKTLRDLERGQRLFRDSAATLEQIQNLQTAYNVAGESFRIVSFNKQFSTIHANASGKIIAKYYSEGEQVGAGVPVLILNSASENNWIVKLGLPDIQWLRVKKNDDAEVRVDTYPEAPFKGTVSLINEGADPVSGLYGIEISIQHSDRKLASGLFANVIIYPSLKQKLWRVPIEAIVEGQGHDAFIFVPSGMTVKKISVKVSYIEGKDVYINRGLEGVSEVITSGSAFLTENSTIVIAKN